jgi:hypothetical protein
MSKYVLELFLFQTFVICSAVKVREDISTPDIAAGKITSLRLLICSVSD